MRGARPLAVPGGDRRRATGVDGRIESPRTVGGWQRFHPRSAGAAVGLTGSVRLSGERLTRRVSPTGASERKGPGAAVGVGGDPL